MKKSILFPFILLALLSLSACSSVNNDKVDPELKTYMKAHQQSLEKGLYTSLDPKHQHIKSLQFDWSTVAYDKDNYSPGGHFDFNPNGAPILYTAWVWATVNGNDNLKIQIEISYEYTPQTGWENTPEIPDYFTKHPLKLSDVSYGTSVDKSVKAPKDSWWNWNSAIKKVNEQAQTQYETKIMQKPAEAVVKAHVKGIMAYVKGLRGKAYGEDDYYAITTAQLEDVTKMGAIQYVPDGQKSYISVDFVVTGKHIYHYHDYDKLDSFINIEIPVTEENFKNKQLPITVSLNVCDLKDAKTYDNIQLQSKAAKIPADK